MAAMFGKKGPKGPKDSPKCTSTTMSIKVSGSKGTMKVESIYDSADGAKRISDDLKKAMDQTKSKSKDMESFDVTTSGSTVTLTITGPIKGQGGMPGLPFGGK
jgi:hypothetical protein